MRQSDPCIYIYEPDSIHLLCFLLCAYIFKCQGICLYLCAPRSCMICFFRKSQPSVSFTNSKQDGCHAINKNITYALTHKTKSLFYFYEERMGDRVSKISYRNQFIGPLKRLKQFLRDHAVK